MAVSPVHAIDITASDADVDDLAHVSNISYVRWIQDVATAHSRAVGYTMDEYRAVGGVFVVRRHEIDYLSPAYAGDRIRLETWVESWKMASSVRMTSILRVADASGQVPEEPVLLAKGKTIWAFVGLADGRVQRFPDQMRAAFAGRA